MYFSHGANGAKMNYVKVPLKEDDAPTAVIKWPWVHWKVFSHHISIGTFYGRIQSSHPPLLFTWPVQTAALQEMNSLLS